MSQKNQSIPIINEIVSDSFEATKLRTRQSTDFDVIELRKALIGAI